MKRNPVRLGLMTMTNSIGYTLLAAIASILVGIAVYEPRILSDENAFLRNFVGHELVSVLGLIVTITTASASNIHLELRRLEAEHNVKNAFEGTRKEVKNSALMLILLFCVAIGIVVAKPVLKTNTYVEAAVNGAALFIMFFNVLVLWTLLSLAFKVGPITFDDDDDDI